MQISTCSSLNGDKMFHAFPDAKSWQRPTELSAISCRDTKLATEKDCTNLYKVLSLSSNDAGNEEIKSAYRAMALKYHPDVCHPAVKGESAKMFIVLHAAYKTLSDPVLREEYDNELGMRESEIEEGSWGSRLRARNREN
ncbi:hypothetical protein RJ639_011302 [Escallonia herrerae]|uniref:J domain-containing protein n=1 Tax=Escallonia herrerae TaxID=1293975 RepID=A0AA88VN91_9ASTE|nr:hypothetical protein RJ639_011302 [Escallonia herrerae]